MDFELDDDQRTLQEAVRTVIAKECSPGFVRSVVDDGVDPSRWWATMVELGWPALAVDESAGGLGGTWVELAVLLEELGRAVDPSPFLATVTQFAPLVRTCGDSAQSREWLGRVAAGTVTGTLALGAVRATATATGWQLDGVARHVVDADRADEIAVVAETSSGREVFVVNRDSALRDGSLAIESIPAVDLTAHLGHLSFVGVQVDADRRLSEGSRAGAVTEAVEEATLGWAVTTVGASQRIVDLTIGHVKQRHQFGVPIGTFQAVKHKTVDMYVAIERARALTQYAALAIAEHDDRRSVAVSMAKAAAGECQELVFQHGFQLFGGMGFTWENDLHLALRRAKLGAALFGSTGEHRRRVGREAMAS